MSDFWQAAIQQVIDDIQSLMEKPPDLDWTCACQAVAIERGVNEQELLEDMKEHFE